MNNSTGNIPEKTKAAEDLKADAFEILKKLSDEQIMCLFQDFFN